LNGKLEEVIPPFSPDQIFNVFIASLMPQSQRKIASQKRGTKGLLREEGLGRRYKEVDLKQLYPSKIIDTQNTLAGAQLRSC
jgi:hypothetical protein